MFANVNVTFVCGTGERIKGQIFHKLSLIIKNMKPGKAEQTIKTRLGRFTLQTTVAPPAFLLCKCFCDFTVGAGLTGNKWICMI